MALCLIIHCSAPITPSSAPSQTFNHPELHRLHTWHMMAAADTIRQHLPQVKVFDEQQRCRAAHPPACLPDDGGQQISPPLSLRGCVLYSKQAQRPSCTPLPYFVTVWPVRSLLLHVVDQLDGARALLAGLRCQVCHADANEQNLLVDEAGSQVRLGLPQRRGSCLVSDEALQGALLGVTHVCCLVYGFCLRKNSYRSSSLWSSWTVLFVCFCGSRMRMHIIKK